MYQVYVELGLEHHYPLLATLIISMSHMFEM